MNISYAKEAGCGSVYCAKITLTLVGACIKIKNIVEDFIKTKNKVVNNTVASIREMVLQMSHRMVAMVTNTGLLVWLSTSTTLNEYTDKDLLND